MGVGQVGEVGLFSTSHMRGRKKLYFQGRVGKKDPLTHFGTPKSGPDQGFYGVGGFFNDPLSPTPSQQLKSFSWLKSFSLTEVVFP